jgi:hypothetical protein
VTNSEQSDAERATGLLLENELALVPPPSGWERGVWRRIDARRKGRQFSWGVFSAGLAFAALVLIVVPRLGGTGTDAATLTVDARAGGIQSRGNVRAGDEVLVTVTAKNARDHILVRIYREDAELLVSCEDALPCARQGRTVTVRFNLREHVRYRFVGLAASAPFTAPRGSYDGDTAAALEGGARLLMSRVLDVR